LGVIPGRCAGIELWCAIAHLRISGLGLSADPEMTMASYQHLLLNDWFPAFAIRRIGFMTRLPFFKKRRRATFNRRII
jgi:hypothetical protein